MFVGLHSNSTHHPDNTVHTLKHGAGSIILNYVEWLIPSSPSHWCLLDSFLSAGSRVFFKNQTPIDWQIKRSNLKGWLISGSCFRYKNMKKRKKEELVDVFYLLTRKGLEIPASFRASSNQLSAAWLALFSRDISDVAGALTGTRTAGSVFVSVLQLSIKKNKYTRYTTKKHTQIFLWMCVRVSCSAVTRGLRRHIGWTSLRNHLLLFL